MESKYVITLKWKNLQEETAKANQTLNKLQYSMCQRQVPWRVQYVKFMWLGKSDLKTTSVKIFQILNKHFWKT